MCAEKSIRTHYKYKRQCSPLIIFPLSISTLCVELVHVCLFVCLFASSGRERVSISHTDTRRPSKYTRRRLSARPPATSHRDPSISLSRWAGRSTWKINYFPFILVPFVRQNWPEINKILGKVLPWSFMVERTVERWAVTHLYYQSHAGCRCGWQPMELWATLGCGYLSETNDGTVSRIGLSGIVFVSSPPSHHSCGARWRSALVHLQQQKKMSNGEPMPVRGRPDMRFKTLWYMWHWVKNPFVHMFWRIVAISICITMF